MILMSAEATPPDVFVPIDFWGFNYRLAQAMTKRAVPVVYYISPQLWASRPWRMQSMREIASRVLVIFPFEEAIYQKAGVPVEFVGHPLVELTQTVVSREQLLDARGQQDRPRTDSTRLHAGRRGARGAVDVDRPVADGDDSRGPERRPRQTRRRGCESAGCAGSAQRGHSRHALGFPDAQHRKVLC